MLLNTVLPFVALSLSVSGMSIPNKDTLEARYYNDGYGGGYGPGYYGGCNDYGCPGSPYGYGNNYYKRDDMQANVERSAPEANPSVFKRADLASPAESTIGTWEGLANGILGSGVGVFGGGGDGGAQQQQAPPQGGVRGGIGGGNRGGYNYGRPGNGGPGYRGPGNAGVGYERPYKREDTADRADFEQ